MTTSELLQQRLADNFAQSLVTLAIDFILNQPIQSLLPPDFIANQLTLGLQTAIESGQTEQWVTEQVEKLRGQIPRGTPEDAIPNSIQAPLRLLLREEMALQDRLIRRLLDHKAVEQLFNEILTDVLVGFTESLKNIAQSSTGNSASMGGKGFGRLRAFGERALKETAVGGLAQVLEQQAQRKIREHIDKSIAKVLDLTAERLSADENRGLQGEYRIHILDVLLSTENQVLLKQIDVVETSLIVSTISQTIRALLLQDNFKASLQKLISTGLEEIGDSSLLEVLNEAGLDQGWRSELEQQIHSLLQIFIEEKDFKQWLSGWIAT